MASSLSQRSKRSKENSSSIAQVAQIDKSVDVREPKKNLNDSLSTVAKRGDVTRRKSTSSVRSSRSSVTPKTTVPSQRSRSNLHRTTIEVDNEDNGDQEGELIDELNTSFASAATINMDTSQTSHNNNHSPISVNVINQDVKKVLRKQELINTYFTKINTGGYYCKLCEGTKYSTKIHKQIQCSDTNLRSHLARNHQLSQVLYPSQRLHYPIKSQVLSADLKKTLDDALIYAIVKDSRPFGDFRKPGFQHFLKQVLPNTNYKGPHRTTVRRRMESLYGRYRQALINELASVTDIALTADSWTNSRRMHFICITAHYYDDGFGYMSKVISFRRFIGRSVALRIRQFIRLELQKLKISGKICSITTDNGANIKLATTINEFGLRIPCLIHGLHLCVGNGVGLWKKKRKTSSIQVSIEEKPIEEEEEDNEMQDGYTEIDEYDQSWVADVDNVCLEDNGEGSSDAETDDSRSRRSSNYDENEDESDKEETPIQQVNHDGNSDNEGEHSFMSSLKEFVYKMMQRTRALIRTINRSSGLDKYVRDQISVKQEEANRRAKDDDTEPIIYNELIMDFRVRWNSSFEMLDRFIKLSSIINDVTFTAKNVDGVTSKLASNLSRLSFNHDDWDWLSALQFVLAPFEHSTRLLSGRSYQTLAVGKMVLTVLKEFLSQQKAGETMVNRLKALLLESFKKYCEANVPPEVEEAITIASFLDPPTHYFLRDDEQFIRRAKQLIVSKSKLDKFKPLRSSSVISTPTPQVPPKLLKKPFLALENFLSKCESSLAPRSTTTTTTSATKAFTIQQEIGYYISSIDKETDFEEYWKKNQYYLPILARLVRHFCAMPMSSVASESAFSMAGYIQRKHRSSLSPTALRYSMLLRNLEPDHFNI